jgi:hypothetical protein
MLSAQIFVTQIMDLLEVRAVIRQDDDQGQPVPVAEQVKTYSMGDPGEPFDEFAAIIEAIRQWSIQAIRR